MPRLLGAILACLVAQCAAGRLPPRLGVLRAGRSESAAEPELDEALYSRQLYVLGHAAQQSLAKSNVLVVGLSGLGAELAKNLALAGIKQLHVHDDAPATLHDLATSFLLTEVDVSAPRAARAVEQLAPLNPHVEMRRLEGPIDATTLEAHGYTCVVAVDQTLEVQLALNEAARAAGVRFVSCSSRGVFGSLFTDLGDSFTATDADGEPVREALLQSVAEDAEGRVVVSTVLEQPHGLSDGDCVRFAELQGAPALCEEGRVFSVQVTGRHSLVLAHTPQLPAPPAGLGGAPYVSGGRLVQVKTSQEHHFLPLSEAVPRGCTADAREALAAMPVGSPPRRAATVHACFCSIDAALAAATAAADGSSPPQLGPALLEAVRSSGLLPQERVDEGLVAAFAHGARGSLSPVAAFVGGVAAQEVLKACTGRFTPLKQFAYFDWLEALPSPLPSAEECAPRGDRYDGQRAVLGESLQAALARSVWFVVGAGAIGCELLKCLALMGVGVDAAGGGAVHLTDMDAISTSNLNRQFLFRPPDVGQPKAAVAARAVGAINPQLKVRHYESKVGEAAVFDEAFWERLDGVANALDNLEARLFVDRQCVAHALPLLDSGTHGVKGSAQVVLPHASESYGASADPPEESIPVCTLKSFPYAIEHVLQWARDGFEGAFVHTPSTANRFLGAPQETLDALEQEDAPEGVPDALAALHAAVVHRPSDTRGCLAWAIGLFNRWFTDDVAALLSTHPPGQVGEDGAPFWGGTRRLPTPARLDAEDPTHAAFLSTAATLRAASLGLPPPSADELSPAALAAALAAAAAEAAPPAVDAGTRARQRAELLAHATGLPRWSGAPQSFEKDDDDNGHMAFVTAAANLRAANFEIPRCDVHTAKRVAGKIVPAIATTTAAVVGLVGMELLKLAQGRHDIESFRNGFINLALPLFTLSEPNPAEVSPLPGGGEFTEWSTLPVAAKDAPLLHELVSLLEAQLKAEVSFLTYSGRTLYSSLSPPAQQAAYLQMPVREAAAAAAAGEPPPPATLRLQASVYDEEAEEDVEVPVVVYK